MTIKEEDISTQHNESLVTWQAETSTIEILEWGRQSASESDENSRFVQKVEDAGMDADFEVDMIKKQFKATKTISLGQGEIEVVPDYAVRQRMLEIMLKMKWRLREKEAPKNTLHANKIYVLKHE